MRVARVQTYLKVESRCNEQRLVVATKLVQNEPSLLTDRSEQPYPFVFTPVNESMAFHSAKR
jgi:hypothetical protein